MTLIRRAIARARSVAGDARDTALRPFQALNRWQADIPDEGRVVLAGMVLLGAGLAFVWPPAAAIAPGILLVVAGLGFNFKHPAAAIALVVVTGAAIVAAVLFAGRV